MTFISKGHLQNNYEALIKVKPRIFHLMVAGCSMVSVYDASDTTPRGFLVGNGFQLGNFDECISVYEASRGIHGKHCLIETRLRLNRSKPPPGLSMNGAVWNIFDPVSKGCEAGV